MTDAHAAKSPAKKAAKKAAAKRGEIVTFTMTDFPVEFLCSGCGELRPTKSFPPIKSNEPEIRKSECRACRTARIEANGGPRRRSTSVEQPADVEPVVDVDFGRLTKAQLVELIVSAAPETHELGISTKFAKAELIELAERVVSPPPAAKRAAKRTAKR